MFNTEVVCRGKLLSARPELRKLERSDSNCKGKIPGSAGILPARTWFSTAFAGRMPALPGVAVLTELPLRFEYSYRGGILKRVVAQEVADLELAV